MEKQSKKLKLSSPSSSSSKSKLLSSSIKEKTCPICLTQISNHDTAVISNCMHAYCLHCLLRWSQYKRSCPLCNSSFNSYFSLSSSFSSFDKHYLPSLSLIPSVDPPNRHETQLVEVRRFLRRKREEISEVSRRSRPVPRRRSFGRLGSVPAEVIAERIHQWRASIYKHGLLAVPFSSQDPHNLDTSMGRERLLHKIEPWIRRELQAILQDPDPTIIVHVATSLYFSNIGKKGVVFSTSANSEDAFLAPLSPFLQESTDMFWHELRCFATSGFTMDTYDEVVEYRKQHIFLN